MSAWRVIITRPTTRRRLKRGPCLWSYVPLVDWQSMCVCFIPVAQCLMDKTSFDISDIVKSSCSQLSIMMQVSPVERWKRFIFVRSLSSTKCGGSLEQEWIEILISNTSSISTLSIKICEIHWKQKYDLHGHVIQWICPSTVAFLRAIFMP